MPDINDLSEREREILYLVASGASNKQIAHTLVISTNTVKVHLRNIFSKIGVASRTEAAMFAVGAGLVDPAGNGNEPGLAGLHSQAIDSSAAETALGSLPAPTRGWPARSRWFVLLGVVALLALGFWGALALRGRGSPAPVSASQPAPTPQPRWQARAGLLTPRRGLAVAAFGNQVYAIAGESAEGVTGVLECYDPAKDSWTALASKPVPVTEVGAAVIGGKIYVPAGQTASGSLTNVLEIYDPDQDRWAKGSPLPVALSRYALAAFEGKLYLFGGWDGEQVRAEVYEYDPDGNEWRARSPMPTARASAGAASASGMLYIFGGLDGERALTVTEIYQPGRDDGQADPWTEGPPLPGARARMGVATVADIIHVFGGEGEDGTPVPQIVIFTQNEGWQILADDPADFGANIGLAPVGEYLYAVGGEIESRPAGTNLAYRAVYTISIPVIVK
jgi:DNA-binding CsgD family transcriptional regulator/N-acetylneuraminic acid mutarotase